MTDYATFLKAAAKRRATAWKLYKGRFSMAEIGAQLGVSKARAHQIIAAERKRRQ